MKIVLNSDVLYHRGTLVRELRGSLPTLLQVCLEQKHEIVVPLTTRLEFDRHQAVEAERERNEIRKAYELLRRVGVDLEESDVATLTPEPDLLALIRQSGVAAVELEPTEEQLREAHRRAALHEDPHPSDSKSDEMRDLVIWMQAVDVARREGGAILLSRDKVHTDQRGDSEAAEVGLARLSSVEDLLEHLNVRTPAASLIQSLVEASWAKVVESAPGLPGTVEVRRVSNPSFVQGRTALASASADVEMAGGAGEALCVTVRFELEDGVLVKTELQNISVNGTPREGVAVAPISRVEVEAAPTDERLARLRTIIGT